MSSRTCSNCGAPIAFPPGSVEVRCPFCGTEQDKDVPATAAPAPRPPRPGYDALRAEKMRAAEAAAREQGRRVFLVLAVIVVLVIGGTGTAFYLYNRHSKRHNQRHAGTTAGTAGVPWYSPACLVDANHDGVLDVAGQAGKYGYPAPTVVDGRTGKLLWKGKPLSPPLVHDDWDAFCVNAHWFGFANDKQFAVMLRAADSRQQTIRRALSDRPQYYGVGHGCISVKAADGRVVGLALPGGDDKKCGAAPTLSIHHITPGVVNAIDHKPDGTQSPNAITAERDGVVYTLTTKAKGTPFLIASARRGDKTLWSVPMRFLPPPGYEDGELAGKTSDAAYQALRGKLAMTVTPGIVVVLGCSRRAISDNKPNTLWAIGLAAATGTERWSTKVVSKHSTVEPESLVYNHRFVVAVEHRDDTLVAIDPTTGHIAWRWHR